MIAIELVESGRFIELDQGFQYAFDANHPAFVDQFDTGNYTFPIDIPAGGANDFVLNFPASFHLTKKTYEFHVKIWLGENVWKRGRLVIDKPGTKTHGGYILAGIRAWDSLERKLYEIDLGGELFACATAADLCSHANDMNAAPAAVNNAYVFPTIRNDKFYSEEINSDYKYFINRFGYGGPGFTPNTTANEDTLLPCPSVNYLLGQIFKNEGYNFTPYTEAIGDFFYNNYPLDARWEVRTMVGFTYPSPAQTYVIYKNTAPPPMAAVQFTDNSTPPFSDPGGLFNPLTNGVNVASAGKKYVKFVVRFKVISANGYSKAVQFCAHLPTRGILFTADAGKPTPLVAGEIHTVNYGEIQDFYSGEITEDITVRVTGLTNGTNGIPVEIEILGGSFEVIDINQTERNVYARSINLQNHVPDVTVKDFMRAVSEYYKTMYVLDEVRMQAVMIPVTSSFNLLLPAEDITVYADPDHEVELIKENTTKSIGFDWPSDDDLLKDNFKTYDTALDIGAYNTLADFPTPTQQGLTAVELITGIRYIAEYDVLGTTLEWVYFTDEYYDRIVSPTGEKEIKVKITPLMMRRYDTPYTGDVLVPAIEQPANSPSMGQPNSRMTSLRIFHFVGYNPILGLDYPFATSQNMLLNSDPIGRHRIQFNDLDPGRNLWEYWKNWIDILDHSEVYHKNFHFDLNYLLRLISSQNPGSMSYMHALNGVKLLIKKAEFTVNQSRIEPTKTDFIIVKS